MRPSFPLVILLALTTLGSGGLVLWQWRELDARHAAAALRDDERTALQRRLAELERRNQQLHVEIEALRASTGSASAAGGASLKEAGAGGMAPAVLTGAAQAARASGEEGDVDIVAALADLPEFQQLLATQAHGKLDAKYAALFKKLNLAPDQASRLQALLLDKQMAAFDVTLAVRDQGLTGQEARDAVATLLKDTRSQIDADIKTLLGTKAYAQYQSYERTLPQRETVDRLAQILGYTSTPLKASQAEQLVTLLAQNKTATGTTAQQTSSAKLPASLTSLGLATVTLAPITTAAVTKAQTFLSAQQLAALKQLQKEQQAQQTLNQLLNGKSGKTGGSTTTTTTTVRTKG